MSTPVSAVRPRRLAAVLIPLALVVAFAPARAEKEWTPGKYMTQAVGRVMGSVRKITQKTEFGLDDGSSCFAAAYVAEGKAVSTTLPLEAGRTYAIIGGGDDDVKDLDLYLLDADGNVVARDVETDAYPVVTYTPDKTGRYRVSMKLASSGTASSFCAFAVMRDGGFDVPADNLAASFARLISLCTAINDKFDGAAFLDNEGELALVGTILKEGETLTQSGIHLPSGSHAFCAAADGAAQDIDLRLVDSDDTVLESDTESDSTPIVVYKDSGTVRLKISDAKSNGATLAIAAMLKIGG